MLNVEHANVYTDFNGLAKLKNEAKSKTPEAIKEVAKQFESIFLNRVLKTMREAKLADGIFDNNQSEFYQDMYDQQLSIHLSGEQGIGLARMIVKQLSPKDETSQEVLGIDDYLNRSVSSARIIKPVSQALDPIKTSDIAIQKHVEEKPQVTPKVIEEFTGKPIETSTQFVSQLLPYAEQAATELGVEAKVLLAQSALETAWGKSVIESSEGKSSHNLFNIKADKSWKGQQTQVSTLEYENGVVKKEMAGFRSYSSYAESFNDYVNFIKNNPRYGKALKVVENPRHYMQALQQAGYATDPAYAQKVMKIYHSKVFSSLEVPPLLVMKQNDLSTTGDL